MEGGGEAASKTSMRDCCYQESSFPFAIPSPSRVDGLLGSFWGFAPVAWEDKMVEHLRHNHGVRGCMNLKSLADWRHGEGKRDGSDVLLHPSEEFLAMMNLFNGKVESIQKILEDPCFIFAHYLHCQQAFNADLKRTHSFPAQGLLERKNDEPYEVRHKRIERESLVKKINDLHLENTFSHPDKTDADILRIKPMLGVDNNSQKDKHCLCNRKRRDLFLFSCSSPNMRIAERER
ncbi:hypothetical protein AXF42_Ash017458 [Apostasia shenzhenica]|uniref:DUF3741 domain-containing protein n=1 Tax=Apostasia shenzhenica TaxID=1088818 RepID=A0A2H9ZZ26_9ASPA|nr:hypothetical protein AXF42_Ash017458 [Apostasia shenzhenica]